MTSTLPATVEFSGASLSIIDQHGTPYVTGRDLAKALGYAHRSAVTRIYARHKAEFTDEMAPAVNLTAGPNQVEETRIFSPRGCHLVAMFSHTERAAAFRRWVLDVLEGLATQPTTKPSTAGLPLPPREADLLRAYLEGALSRFCGVSPAEAELQALRGLVDGVKGDLRSARLSLEHAEAKSRLLVTPRPQYAPGSSTVASIAAAERAASPPAPARKALSPKTQQEIDDLKRDLSK